MERENLHKEEIELFQENLNDKDAEIKRLRTNYSQLEEEAETLMKKFNIQMEAKDNDFEKLNNELSKKGDEEINKKLEKITELERKIHKINLEHQDEVTHLREQIEKYQNILKEKDLESENKILDFSAAFRKKETKAKTENFKLKKDLEVNFPKITNLATN